MSLKTFSPCSKTTTTMKWWRDNDDVDDENNGVNVSRKETTQFYGYSLLAAVP